MFAKYTFPILVFLKFVHFGRNDQPNFALLRKLGRFLCYTQLKEVRGHRFCILMFVLVIPDSETLNYHAAKWVCRI